MVMEKPMQLTMVSDVPLDCSGAFRATSVENRGESATTNSPQKNRKLKKAKLELINKKMGDNKQQRQDSIRESVAILFAPKEVESTPLTTQAIPPEAIIRKENRGTLISALKLKL